MTVPGAQRKDSARMYTGSYLGKAPANIKECQACGTDRRPFCTVHVDAFVMGRAGLLFCS